MHLVQRTHHHPATGYSRGTTSLCASSASVAILGCCLRRCIDVLIHMHQYHKLQRLLLIGNLQESEGYVLDDKL